MEPAPLANDLTLATLGVPAGPAAREALDLYRAAVRAKAWERATSWHPHDDAHITFGAICRTRRQFVRAGWDVRLVWDESGVQLDLEVRPRDGYPRPAWPSTIAPDESLDVLARAREHAPECADEDDAAAQIAAQNASETEAA